MANYGAVVLRRSAAVVEGARAHARSTRKAIARFARPQAFAPPPDAEAAAVRAVRNVASFRVYYAALLWVLLLASLFPRRRASMLFLMAFSKVVLFYGGLLRALPNSTLLHRVLDRRLVFALALAVIFVELAVTGALPQLLLALGVGVPVVLLHAVFRVRDDLDAAAADAGAKAATAAGDLVAISEKKKEEDLEKGSDSE